MKKLFFSIIMMSFVVCAFAQKQGDDIATITDRLVEKYQLDEAQSVKMLQIQTRHQKNVESIQAIAETNPIKYRQKRKSVIDGTKGSIQLILNQEQLKIFFAEQAELRKLRAAKLIELKEANATPEEMQDALLDIEEKQ